ncbi:MAG: hypothetical protein JO004_06470, partial [Methylobacteriaceae bacterium]|nr:hypothetical protein [Methylobacteriaceae bacterium]
MNELSNKYAMAALKERRASIAGQITDDEARLRRFREALVNIHGALQLFDDAIEPDAIAPKKPCKRVMLFRHGELNRLILLAMRKSEGRPMPTAEIVASIVETLGHDADAAKGMRNRVRANLRYLAED